MSAAHSTTDRRRPPSPSSGVWQQGKQLVSAWMAWLIGSGQAYSFRRRRAVALMTVVVALLLAAWIDNWMHAALLRRSVMTGWTLMACLGMLIAIGMRRRIPIVPLGSMSTWTQVHIYTGLFALGIFALHVPAIWSGRIVASGGLEGSLSVLFLLVSGSGVYGLIASRRLPWRLTQVGEQVRYDQIPLRRRQISDAVQREIELLQHPAAIRVIGSFHDRYLHRYFNRNPSWWYILLPNSAYRRRTMAGLQELHRYLDDNSSQTLGNLSALIRIRDDLDYQFALQWRLRVWVTLHAIASVVLLVLAIVHAVFATRFVVT